MKHNSAQKKAFRDTPPDRLSTQLNKALELHKNGDISAAKNMYQRIIDRHPQHIDALYLLGTSCINSTDFQKAIYYLSKAVTLNPQSSLIHNNLGVALEYSGDLVSAIEHFGAAIGLDQNNAEAHVNLGNAFQQQGDYNRAVDCYTMALKIAPSEKAYLGIGNTYREMFKPDHALSCYRNAIEISPNLIEAYNGIALIYHEQGKLDEAMQIYRKALSLPCDHTETQWNHALLNLFCGNYVEGWEGYEYGRLVPNAIRQTLLDSDNEWSNSVALTGKSILVYSEQGIGDEIMFSSCIPELKKLTDKIHIMCDKRLADIYRRSFSPVVIHEICDPQSIKQCIVNHDIDYSIPSGSLPRYFRNDISAFGQGRQYLYAAPDKIERWRQRYDALDARPKIGIAWFGGKNNYAKAQRSTVLNDWADLLMELNASFINLQYGDCATSIAKLHNSHGIKIHDWDDSDPLVDMDDYFAKVQALDLVITIDNSTAHVAGSLGVPTFVFLPETPDWRWLSHGNTSPWYASLHLLRKSSTISWKNFISRSKTEIEAFLNNPDNSMTIFSMQKLHTSAIGIDAREDNEESNSISIEILYDANIQPSAALAQLRCAVITPIGPGHEDILNQCKQSLTKAIDICPGSFVHIEHIFIDDSLGKMGRSHARNIAVRTAYDRGIDWIFFIDADDLMAPNAFEIASLLADQYDAIWGKICSFDHTNNRIDEREGQLGETTHLHDILFNDPYLTLQMGHFVRTKIALANPFNEQMDTGEDFDYYLRVWNKYRCIRINAILFINRRGFHSSGPRSANGSDWRTAVVNVIDRFCEDHEPVTSFSKYNVEVKFLIRNPFDLIQRQLLYKDFFEIKELEFIKNRIVKNACILEVGANIGNHIVYYSKFTSCTKIIAIEPNPDAIAILKKNLQLNDINNVNIQQIGAGADNSRFRLKTKQNNLGATSLVRDVSGDIQVAKLDDITKEHIDFIKIDVENMELDVLEGAKGLIKRNNPLILIEVMNANVDNFKEFLTEINYKIIKTFKNVNASNFFIEPA